MLIIVDVFRREYSSPLALDNIRSDFTEAGINAKNSSGRQPTGEGNLDSPQEYDYADGHLSPISVKPANALVLHSEAHKPKFLYNLEQYLVRELNSIGANDAVSEDTRHNDSRLQVSTQVNQSTMHLEILNQI